jgi:hypothetical protein
MELLMSQFDSSKKTFLHQKPTPYPAMCSIRVFRHELDSLNERNCVAAGIAVEDTDAIVSFCRGSLPRLSNVQV